MCYVSVYDSARHILILHPKPNDKTNSQTIFLPNCHETKKIVMDRFIFVGVRMISGKNQDRYGRAAIDQTAI